MFNYYRLNVDRGLEDMKLDEWRERGQHRLRMGRLIAGCRSGRKEATMNGTVMNGKSKETMPNGNANDNTNGNANGTPNSNADPHNEKAAPEDNLKNPGAHSSNIPSWFQPKNKTLDTIRRETATYLSNPSVQDWLDECARKLVDGRRGRAKTDPARWERACFGAWFMCRHRECPRGEKEYSG